MQHLTVEKFNHLKCDKKVFGNDGRYSIWRIRFTGDYYDSMLALGTEDGFALQRMVREHNDEIIRNYPDKLEHWNKRYGFMYGFYGDYGVARDPYLGRRLVV